MGEFLARVNVLDKGFVELVERMGTDHTVVESARVSLLGDSKGDEADKKLIKYLIENHHETPFEQVEFRFRVKCPMFVARQWHRHRTWSYNEVSRRYTSEDIEFYIPKELRKQAESNRQASTDEVVTGPFKMRDPGSGKYYEVASSAVGFIYSYCYQGALQSYEALLQAGVAREQARMILPQNTYTMFYAKVDLRNLLNFISLRDSEHAQQEIRVYAQALKTLIKPYVPWTMEYWNAR